MHGRTITLLEHERTPVGSGDAALSPAEAERLVALSEERPGFVVLGHRSLKLSQFVGLVNLGNGRVLEILPKVGEHRDPARGRGTLLRLLREAYDLPLFSGGEVDHGLLERELLDVFVLAYLRTLATLIRAGLLRRYEGREEDLGVIRGRLLLKQQVTVHAMRMDRIACRFDELTNDNPWNQVLKAALVAVRPWARGLESGRLWLEMAAAFDEIELRSDALALLRQLTPNRQARHYDSALRWAGWILQLLSPDLRRGTSSAPELLFDMNRLFEAAVAAKFRRQARSSGLQVHAQARGRHLAISCAKPEQGHFELRPDLVLRQGDEVLAVADTKWSAIEKNRRGHLVPAGHHAYQINAYAAAYPCKEVALIYPWSEGLAGALASSYQLPDASGRAPLLHVICVDVEKDGLPLRLSSESPVFANLG